ncbi:MAG: cupredoxin domain-containing protein [Erythrobacter sp.]|nr:cupredoxin domain-containing protein [Erythrobacter sp.]
MRCLFLAPIVLLAGCASTHVIQPQLSPASVEYSRAQRVEVTLDNFSFAPADLHLQAGRPIALVVTNAASGGHNFTAPEFFAAAQIMPGHADLVASGQLSLSGGQSVTVNLIPAAGTYRLTCTHLGHAVLGMTGTITVE